MNIQLNGKQRKNNLASFFIMVFISLSGWELAARFGLISSIFFPPPTVIGRTFLRLLVTGTLLENTGVTLFRLIIGSLAGIIPGITVGVLMGWSSRIRSLLDPIVAAVHPVPKIAIFPLVLIIFGIGEISNIVVIAISAFFPSLISSMTGVQHLDPVYFDVAQNYGASRWKMFSRVLFPSSLPSILSGVRLGLNTGLLLTIALELLSAKQGLGVMIWFSWQTLRVEELFSTLIMISILGISINIGLKALFEWIAPWGKEFSQNRS